MGFNASLIRVTRSGAYSNFGRRRQGFSLENPSRTDLLLKNRPLTCSALEVSARPLDWNLLKQSLGGRENSSPTRSG